ncbi:MAG: MarR family winged helix-turn-helix transcriptional regulator [Jatrophihabitans sp.]|uniref:MarR family winged helix-turn-helix transcriptional regulator n=1 Tax=Jatrophihabitans sp. TaxID=1932789 RepID=UPI003911355A
MAANRIDQTHTWLLSRANARAQAIRVEAFAAAGSSGYLSRLLGSLADEGPASQADLSRRTGIDPSDIVAAVNELESRKFLTRRRDPLDARRHVVELTRAGRAELTRLDAVVADIQDRFLAPLSETERRQLSRILAKLTADPPALSTTGTAPSLTATSTTK